MQGNIELQPEGKRPHLHALIKTTATLCQKKKSIKPRLKTFFVLKKAYSTGWNTYSDKDEEDKELRAYLNKFNIKESYFHLKKNKL